jgi:mRNA-degrading endonuclease toxin of MazEF toxin-antitoxin module
MVAVIVVRYPDPTRWDMKRLAADAAEDEALAAAGLDSWANAARRRGPSLRRGELWWADSGNRSPVEQIGRRPVVVWESDALTSVLASVLVVPLTTNLDCAHLADITLSQANEGSLPDDSVALGLQVRAVSKSIMNSSVHERPQ